MKIARSSGKRVIINAIITLVIKLTIIFVIFLSIPSKVRSFQAVNLSIQLFALLITTVSLFQILAIWKFVLKLSIDKSSLKITDQILFFEKNFTMNTPVDICCRILGRGIGRVIYAKSLKDGSERYFGQKLDSSDQDEIVSWIQRNQ